ncbi:hypothetical protein AB5I41_28360 [Sphingomonas sp. MMS24-JH45]
MSSVAFGLAQLDAGDPAARDLAEQADVGAEVDVGGGEEPADVLSLRAPVAQVRVGGEIDARPRLAREATTSPPHPRRHRPARISSARRSSRAARRGRTSATSPPPSATDYTRPTMRRRRSRRAGRRR